MGADELVNSEGHGVVSVSITGEDATAPPESSSAARSQGATRNLGDPALSVAVRTETAPRGNPKRGAMDGGKSERSVVPTTLANHHLREPVEERERRVTDPLEG